MKTRSVFKFWAYLSGLLLLTVTVILIMITWFPFTSPVKEWSGLALIYPFMIFTWAWLMFGEMRNKVIKVEMGPGEICIKNYFGFGTPQIFQLSEFDGFEISFLPSSYHTYEFLYLVKQGKKLVKVSEFYHANYAELKRAVEAQVKDLGEVEFSLMGEIKDIFQFG